MCQIGRLRFNAAVGGVHLWTAPSFEGKFLSKYTAFIFYLNTWIVNGGAALAQQLW